MHLLYLSQLPFSLHILSLTKGGLYSDLVFLHRTSLGSTGLANGALLHTVCQNGRNGLMPGPITRSFLKDEARQWRVGDGGSQSIPLGSSVRAFDRICTTATLMLFTKGSKVKTNRLDIDVCVQVGFRVV